MREIEGMGRRALAVRCDVTDRAQVDVAVERTVAELGSVDILVNNAGTLDHAAQLLDQLPELWKRDLRAEYHVPQDFFGTATTPLIEGRLLIVNVGAPGGPCVAGLDKATGREVWRVRRNPAPGTAPDYGMRGVRFVEWAADSSAVTVDIGGGQKLTFPVP